MPDGQKQSLANGAAPAHSPIRLRKELNLGKPGAIDDDRANMASEVSPNPLATAASDKSDGDVGSALRQAFRATVEEQVPDEMLDLLSRLS